MKTSFTGVARRLLRSQVGAFAAASALLLLGAGQTASAATSTWGAGNTTLWSTGFNTTPTSASSTALVFGADSAAGTAAGDVITNDSSGNFTIGNITFNVGAPSYTINGNTIVVGVTGTFLTNNSGVAQTINANVLGGNFAEAIVGNAALTFGGKYIWGGTQTLTINNTGLTTFTNMDINDSSTVQRTATIAGSGNVVITGTISNGTGNGTSVAANLLTYAGTGSLTLSGNNTYTSTTTAAQGALIAGADVPGSGTGPFGSSSIGSVYLGSKSYTGTASILTNGAWTIGRSITETTGATNVALVIGGMQTSGTSQFTNNVNMVANTTLTSAAGGTVIFSGVISGATNLLIGSSGQVDASGVTAPSGGGIVELTGTNTFGGAGYSVTIQNGTTLNIANAGAALGNAGNDLNFNNGTLQFGAVFDPSVSRTMNFQSGGATFDTNGYTITFANSVGNGGAGGLTLADSSATPGVLVLAAANNYAGATTVNSGTLKMGGSGTLGSASGNLAVNAGGTFDLNGTSQAAGNFSGTGGTVTNGGGAASTLTVGNGTLNATTGTYAGAITDGSGGVSLAKVGAGTTTLTGVNTYTGNTVISGGALVVGGANGTLGGTAISTSGGAGTLGIGTAGSTAATTLGSGSAGSVTINNGGSLSLVNGAINSLVVNTGSGSAGLTFNGGSSLAMDVSGGSADQITLGSGVNVFANGTITVDLTLLSNLAGGTLTLIAGDFSSSGTTNFVLGTTTNTSFLNGYTLSLSETDSGLLLIEAMAANAYWKGGTSASWASLNNFTTDAGGTTASTSPLNSNTNVTFNAAGAANYAATTLDGGYTIGSLTFNTGGVGIAPGSGGSLTIASSGGIIVSPGLGAVTETISAPVVLGATQTWSVGDAASTLVVSGDISGSGFNLSKSGSGTLVLSGNNTYTGSTAVGGGNLDIQSDGALGGTSGVTVSSGAALQLQGGISTTAATPLLVNGSGSGAAGALENVGGNNTYSGLLTLGSGSTVGSDSGNLNLSNTGVITGNGFNLTLAGAGNGTLAGVIGTGSGALIKTGSGVWTLTGANTYAGGTTVNGGTLLLSGSGTLGGAIGALTVNTGGTLDLGGTSQAVGSLTGTGGAITDNGAAATLTIGGGNATGGNFAGSLADGTGSLSLAKIGTGTLTLSGANTYSGATAIDAGALNLANNSALGSTSDVTVAGGAALQLTGASEVDASPLMLNGAGVSASPNGALENVSGANTYAGLVTLGSSATIGSDAGSLDLSNTGTIAGTGYTLTLAGAGNGTLAGNLATGSGGLVKTGAGTWTLAGTDTYTGATTVNGGTLGYTSIAALSDSSALNLGSGSAAVGLNYAGSGGTLGLALNLTGTTGNVTLSNSGTGAIVYSSAPIFSGAGARNLLLGASTDAFGGSIGGITDSSSGATSIIKNGLTNSTWFLTGTNTFTGNITIYGGVLSGALNGGTLTLTGTSAGYSIYQGNGVITRSVGTTAANAAAGGLNWEGNAGFAALGGSLVINLTTGVNDPVTNAANELVWAINFDASGGPVLAFGSTTADSQVQVLNTIALESYNSTAGTVRTIYVEKGAGGDSALLSGALVDGWNPTGGSGGTGAAVSGAVAKTGAGTLIFGGANTYTGATTVSAGALLMNGDESAQTGAVSVLSGATLGGNGVVGGATTIAAGGFLRPGATVGGTGVLTFNNNVTFATGATLALQINGAATRGIDYSAIDAQSSTLTGSGALVLNFGALLAGGSTLDLFSTQADPSTNFTSVSAAFTSVTLTGAYSGSLTSGGLGGTWTDTVNGQTFSLDDFTGVLTVTGSAIPEPATCAALIGLLALAVAGFLRRRRAE